LTKEVTQNGHFSKFGILQLYWVYYKKNAPYYSKPDYTGLQLCNHDTIKIHFQTVEKQQAKDKQLSFKTNTHSLL